MPTAYDATGESGIRGIAHSYSAAAGDWNGDGWPDLLVVPHYEAPARLYRNDQGTFRRVGRRLFPATRRDRHECAWGDVNGDDLLDLYCTIGGGRGLKRKSNELWIQRRDGSFVNRARAFRVRDRNGRGRATTFLDVNNDGFLDLYVGNGFPRHDGFRSKNKLFINVRGREFRRARGYGVNRQIGGSSIQAIDYDRDGWTDLLVCGKKRLFLYRNRRGRRFTDVSRREGVRGPCEAAALVRIDRDRRLDLARVSRRFLVVKKKARGRFRTVYRRRLNGGGHLATGSVDNRAGADLYVVQSNETTGASRDHRDLMLLARRGGRRFKSLRIPQTRRGSGNFAEPIDHDLNGRTDFVVMNGENKARGPIRLIAFR